MAFVCKGWNSLNFHYNGKENSIFCPQWSVMTPVKRKTPVCLITYEQRWRVQWLHVTVNVTQSAQLVLVCREIERESEILLPTCDYMCVALWLFLVLGECVCKRESESVIWFNIW